LRIKFRRIFALFANERKNLGLILNLTKGLVVSSKVNVSRGWAAQEFGVADFGDKRLTSRLISLADRFSDSPESPINQACYGLAETKGAYRFFQNDKIDQNKILKSHIEQTVNRAKQERTVLAIQDTSYISWGHPKTKGLGVISRAPGKNVKMREFKGLVMHTCFAVSTAGVPLGLLSQKTFAREPVSEELKAKRKRGRGTNMPIEEKESIRWLESLKKVHESTAPANVKVVTVCDREGDFYELFELAHRLGSSTLIRAKGDRSINRASLYSEQPAERLQSYLRSLPSKGEIKVEIPAKDECPHRVATLDISFGAFTMNPPRNIFHPNKQELPDLQLHAILVVEKNPPPDQDALEWMLITDLKITSFEEAVEKVKWYCLRWRIEVFHKILKSGLKVEECRLGTADRLVRYLTVMSIIAWRIFWITLVSRSYPAIPCTTLLAGDEWKVLYHKVKKTKSLPKEVPTLKEVVQWIAQLGGFLARKGDGDPGPIALWRGWKRLCDLSEGWNLANE
jgi:hypothetical protein